MASPEIEALTSALARLPGLGPRSARRAVLHLLKKREAALAPLLDALARVEERPLSERGRPVGGSSLVEASLEWRQRVYGDFGAVAFVDAGSVGTGTSPGLSDLRVGAGLGVRYFTAIGPIRADVGLPLVKQRGSSGYGLYVGIGQAF